MSCRRIRSHSNCDPVNCPCSLVTGQGVLILQLRFLKTANPSGSGSFAVRKFDEVDDIDARIADQPECADMYSLLRRKIDILTKNTAETRIRLNTYQGDHFRGNRNLQPIDQGEKKQDPCQIYANGNLAQREPMK